jgi:hypothetical protein
VYKIQWGGRSAVSYNATRKRIKVGVTEDSAGVDLDLLSQLKCREKSFSFSCTSRTINL